MQGFKTVGNCALSEREFEIKTEEARKKVFTCLVRYLVGRKVLDFGCGWGRLSIVLSLICREVHGIDIADWAIEQAKKTLTTGTFTLFDGYHIPYLDGSFGGVLSWTVLQHIPSYDIERTCQEINRVMEKDGIMLLYENTSIWMPNKSHIWFRSADTYKNLFYNYSVQHEEIIPNADGFEEDHVLLVLKKDF